MYLYQEALENGLNPKLTQEIKEQEYDDRKSNREKHISFATKDGSVVKLHGYCNDDKMSSGTYIEGVEVCLAGTTFSKEYIDNKEDSESHDEQ